jgi:hypothetical protein
MVHVYQQMFTIQVNDKPIKQYAHEGRTFVEARKDNQYFIKLKNDSSSKVLAVCSVDGVNVITGDPATDDGAGYIINGYSSIEVKGFRTSNEEVHPFIFSDKDKSYAAKSEQMEHNSTSCGVIGVKFFAEKYYPPISITTYTNTPYVIPNWYEYNKYGSTCGGISGSGAWGGSVYRCTCDNISVGTSVAANQNCSYTCTSDTMKSCEVTNNSIDFDMGTKFSDKSLVDKVKEAEFEKGNLLYFQEVFYASREVLEKMGIVFDKSPSINFPLSFTSSKFCQLPKK